MPVTENEAVAASRSALIAQYPSASTRRAYDHDWGAFLLWLEEQKVTVTEVRPRHVQAYLTWMRERGMKKATITRALSVLREVYAALVRDEVIEVSPAREVKKPKMDAQPKTPHLGAEHVTKLVNLPLDERRPWYSRRNRACVRALFGLGWRRQEIAELRVDDFAPDFSTMKGKLKGDKQREVAVPDWLADELQDWLTYADIKSGWIFQRSPSNKRAISGDIVYQIVKAACAEAGVPRISPHGLRRSNITITGERGVSLKQRQLAVGHNSQSTTERYDQARDATKFAPGSVLADLIKKDDSK
jgi:site-specific recombinase XerD